MKAEEGAEEEHETCEILKYAARLLEFRFCSSGLWYTAVLQVVIDVSG
jgi:hypothetical protein